MAGQLNGRVALVTGASSGIGEGTAEALAAAGASVVVVARRVDRLEGLVAKITAAGGKAIALPADIADEVAAKGVVEETVKRLGRLDILINCAGINQLSS